MKKNVLLLTILSSLIAIAYFLDHRDIENKSNELFNLSVFSTIKLVKVEIINRQNVLYLKSKNYPASSSKVGQLLERLGRIKVKRIILGKKRTSLFANDFFTPSVNFSIDKTNFEVSHVNELTGAYFIWNKEKDIIYEVIDTYINEGMYKTEVQADVLKYQNLINYLSADYKYYLLNKIILNDELKNPQRVEFDLDDTFEVDLKLKETIPKAYSGVLYNVEKIVRITDDIKKLVVIDIIDVDREDELSESVGSIMFDEDFEVELYLKLGKYKGKYLLIPEHKYIYQLTDRSAEIFNLDVQSFWKKNIYFLKSLNPGIWSKCDLVFKKGKLEFEIKTGEALKIRHKEQRTIDTNVGNQLLSFLSGMKPVKFIGIEMDKGKKVFDLHIVDQKYSVYLSDKYLIVWHRDLYYYYSRSNFSTEFKKEGFFNK
jgi:hypothetical protein